MVEAPVGSNWNAADAPPRRSRRPLLIAAIAGTLLAASLAVAWYVLAHPPAQPFLVSGRIDGYETDIGAKIPGRVGFVAVREGDRVRKGQVLVRLDDAELQAQLRGSSARIAATEQLVQQVRAQQDVITSQMREGQLSVQQAGTDADGRIAQAESDLAAARAQLDVAQAQVSQANSELGLARVTRNRDAQLVATGDISRQVFDEAQTTFESARETLEARQAAVIAVQRQVDAAGGVLTQARSTGLNTPIGLARIESLRDQLGMLQAQLRGAQAQVADAQSARADILAQLAYLRVASPIDGIVTARAVEPGAVVGSGKTLLSIIDPNAVFLRAFVAEGSIGQVRIGQRARVILDSAPQQPLDGHVSEVDAEASFTPENVYFRDDRVKQVFGIKISIDRPDGLAKPGMPADATLLD